MKLTTLKEALKDWTDFDVAEYKLSVALGLFDPENKEKDETFATGVKHVFWTDNKLGNELHEMLLKLVKLKILESREHNQEFRWNANWTEEKYNE